MTRGTAGNERVTISDDSNRVAVLEHCGAVRDARTYGAAGDGITDDSAALRAADAAGGSCLLRKGTHLIKEDLALSAEWVFARGAALKPASGVTLEFASKPGAHLSQIFDLSAGGKVVFSGLNDVFPQWWGATGAEAEIDTQAVQAAIAAIKAGRVVLTRRFYTRDTVVLNDNKSLIGLGNRLGGLLWVGDNKSGMVQIGTLRNGKLGESTTGVHIRSLTLDVAGDHAPLHAVDVRTGKWTCSISDCYINGRSLLNPNYTGTGIRLAGYNFGIRIFGNDIERWECGIFLGDNANSNWIFNNSIINNRYGMSTAPAGVALSNVIVRDNLFELNLVAAIHASGAATWLMEGNRFESNGPLGHSGVKAQIYARNAEGWKISGNYFTTGVALEYAIYGFSLSISGRRNWVSENTLKNHGASHTYFVGANERGEWFVGANQSASGNAVSTVVEMEQILR